MSEPLKTCSIISRGTISTAGCLDLQKYAYGSDNERGKRLSILFYPMCFLSLCAWFKACDHYEKRRGCINIIFDWTFWLSEALSCILTWIVLTSDAAFIDSLSRPHLVNQSPSNGRTGSMKCRRGRLMCFPALVVYVVLLSTGFIPGCTNVSMLEFGKEDGNCRV